MINNVCIHEHIHWHRNNYTFNGILKIYHSEFVLGKLVH
jgi:hypothetical protein